MRLALKILACVALLVMPLGALNAQDAPQATAPATEHVNAQTQAPQETPKPTFNRADYNSLVFTHWEHVAIRDARNSRGSVRAPTDFEIEQANRRSDDPLEKPPPEEREIRLSGIVFNGAKDWTIWLNEERVTPEALPEEILDLKVFKSYIEVKWFDEYTNQIFPIRLRPHQRFNIDTRIFLPG